jgi:hypothetical protein
MFSISREIISISREIFPDLARDSFGLAGVFFGLAGVFFDLMRVFLSLERYKNFLSCSFFHFPAVCVRLGRNRGGMFGVGLHFGYTGFVFSVCGFAVGHDGGRVLCNDSFVLPELPSGRYFFGL